MKTKYTQATWHTSMAAIEVIVNEALTEDKLVELWQEYPCLYAVQSAEFKNRDLRQQAAEEIAEKLEQSGKFRGCHGSE